MGAETFPLENANISTVRISLKLPGNELVYAHKNSSSDLGGGSFSWAGKVEGHPMSFLSFVCVEGFTKVQFRW